MKTLSCSISTENLDQKLDELRTINPNFLCLFFSSSEVKQGTNLSLIAERFPEATVVGCSTAGEISESQISDGTISVLAIHFDKVTLDCAKQSVEKASHSYDSARKVGLELKRDDLKALLVLSPGLNINGSDVARGFSDAVGSKVVVFGGLAGDGVDFKKTFTLLNAQPSHDEIVAVGFYGESFKIATGSKGGWSPFGPARRVTKSEDNILYELDGKPALDLYKEYLGEKAEDLPASGLFYPFSILKEDHSQSGLIRTILDVNHEDKSLVLAGNLPTGSSVCLMHADIDELIEGAEGAARGFCIDSSRDGAAFLISCVGRRIVMSDDAVEEVEAVKDILGENTSIAGFYSYGEISPFETTGRTELHNQTMTVAYITET
ncbi:MAG: hypothetical protein COB36_02935 [Alphaproteobacteria bacterium]|nr:MAG: hypothetical protein COB36_02935 [Alphaproteobacteria bacterium]